MLILLTFLACTKGEWVLEAMMFYHKCNQVVIPIATTVPDVIFLLEPVILVSGTWYTAIDLANHSPPQSISQDYMELFTFTWRRKQYTLL